MAVSIVRTVAEDVIGEQPRKWGTPEWFGHLLSTQGLSDPSAYFGLSGYHRFRHRQIVSFVQDSGLPRQRDMMLDIGCGTGHMTESLRHSLRFKSAVGIDFVPDLGARIKSAYPKVEFQSGQLPDLEFEDNQFDFVVAAEVLYYLAPDVQHQALREIRRILRPNGIFLFTSALGEKYFTSDSAAKLLRTYFKLCEVGFCHNRAYRALLGPVNTLHRLNHVLKTNCEPGTEESRRRLSRWRWALDNAVIRFMLAIGCRLTSPLLDSRVAPSFLHHCSRLFAPRLTETNVSILAMKDGS